MLDEHYKSMAEEKVPHILIPVKKRQFLIRKLRV
jgi:hypothetical protein